MDISVETKGVLDSINGSVESLKGDLKAMQTQLDAVDAQGRERVVGGGAQKSIAEEIAESPEFQSYAEGNGRGVFRTKIADFHKKAVMISDFGPQTTHFTSDREQAIVGIPFRRLFARDLLRIRQTEASHIDYVKVSSFNNVASPQTSEGAEKGESSLTFELASQKISTIATWIACSKQILSDMGSLKDAVDSHLLYAIRLKEETEILLGSGVGEDFTGLVTVAEAFDASELPLGGWTLLDVLGHAISQNEQRDYPVDGIVLSIKDFWLLALSKDSQGRYLLGDPAESATPRLWGRPVAASNSMAEGSFLVGWFQGGATLYDRLSAIVEISDSHSDFFTKNLLALRAELRSGLVVTRPEAFTTGSLSTSPA